MENRNIKLRIGTRGSPLALAQAQMVQARIKQHAPGLDSEIVVIKTSGDWRPQDGETLLAVASGGKAQFAKEIEEALLAGTVDIGVHSMKDMDSSLPPGLVIRHMLPREDVRDALILHPDLKGRVLSLADLPHGALIGTASARRAAMLGALRPDLQIVPLRGNVGTRLEKIRAGQVQASLLALAGLRRLGLEHDADIVLDPAEFIPCAGQGAVGIEMREDRAGDLAAVLDPLNDPQTLYCVSLERAFLKDIGASCRSAVGLHARCFPNAAAGEAHTTMDVFVNGHYFGPQTLAALDLKPDFNAAPLALQACAAKGAATMLGVLETGPQGARVRLHEAGDFSAISGAMT